MSAAAPEPRVVPGWLALGDSYTIGEGVAEAERWPNQVAEGLRAEGLPMAPPRILAATGWTSGELLSELDASAQVGRWGLVSLLIGVNDLYRGLPPSVLRENFGLLLERAVALTGGRPERVLAVSIPDWSVTPFARAEGRDPIRIAAEIDAGNRLQRELCREHGVAQWDIVDICRERGAEPAMLGADDLHPSGVLYALWSSRLLPAVRNALVTR